MAKDKGHEEIAEHLRARDTLSQSSRGNGHRSLRSAEASQDEERDEFREEDLWDLGTSLENSPPVEPPAAAADDEALPHSFGNRRRFGFEMDKGRGVGLASSSQWTPVLGRTTSASRNIPHMQSGLTANGPLRPLVQSSAPMNIPDWSKIMGEREKKAVGPTAEEEEEDSETLVPPHLIVQRQSMRENHGFAMSFSVCEGAGRTLKGRDQKRVRNAVLRQTGFFDET